MFAVKRNLHKTNSYTFCNVGENCEAVNTSGRSSTDRDFDNISKAVDTSGRSSTDRDFDNIPKAVDTSGRSSTNRDFDNIPKAVDTSRQSSTDRDFDDIPKAMDTSGRSSTDRYFDDIPKAVDTSGRSSTDRDFDDIPKAVDTSGRSSTDRDFDDIPEAMDGGWGWVVMFSSFMHNFLVDGFCYSFGTFVADFLIYFGDTNARTQLLNSTINGVYHCMGFVAGSLMDKVGCRRLTIIGVIVASVGLFLSTFSPNLDIMILLYGVVGGFGFGLLHTPSVVIIGQYFNKHRALATGIAVCGSGIGGFAFAPLSVLLIETYDWKGALWILSAIVLNGVVFAAFYRPLQRNKKAMLVSSTGTKSIQEKNNFRYKHLFLVFKQTFNLSLLMSPTFALYSLSGILVGIGYFMPFNFLPIFASDLDLSASDGALLLSVMGIFNTVSRILIGWLSDQSWTDSIIINSMILLIGGIATCFVPLYSTYAILMIYSAVYGTTAGSYVLLMSVILVELKGEKMLPNTYGFFNTLMGISMFIGGPIAGALSDLTESYDAAFYFSGGTMGLAGLLCFPLRRIARWEHDRNSHQDETSEPQLTSMQILHL